MAFWHPGIPDLIQPGKVAHVGKPDRGAQHLFTRGPGLYEQGIETPEAFLGLCLDGLAFPDLPGDVGHALVFYNFRGSGPGFNTFDHLTSLSLAISQPFLCRRWWYTSTPIPGRVKSAVVWSGSVCIFCVGQGLTAFCHGPISKYLCLLLNFLARRGDGQQIIVKAVGCRPVRDLNQAP